MQKLRPARPPGCEVWLTKVHSVTVGGVLATLPAGCTSLPGLRWCRDLCKGLPLPLACNMGGRSVWVGLKGVVPVSAPRAVG